MSRLSRFTQLIFGSTASSNQIAKFGSLEAGSPQRYSGSTITPAIVQALSNYLAGWFNAVDGSYSPAIEDLNALCYLYAYQLAYLMETGIPEYDSGTTYYNANLALEPNGYRLYMSLTDNNTGNPLSDTSHWTVYGNQTITVTTNTIVQIYNNIIRSDSTAGNNTITLPSISSCIAQRFTIKDVGNGSFTTSVQGHAAETIDGNNIYATALGQYDSITVYNNGTSWDTL